MLYTLLSLACITNSKQTCDATVGGTATINMSINTPDGVVAEVSITDGSGQTQLVESGSITVGTGEVHIRANRAREGGTRVGTVYAPETVDQVLCLSAGDIVDNSIDYKLDESGQRLYVLDATEVLAIAADQLDKTGSIPVDASFSEGLTSLQDAAFDRLGRLWVVDANELRAYTDLLVGGQAPDISLTGPEIDNGSVPGPVSIAFNNQDMMFMAHQAGDYIAVFAEDQTLSTGEVQALYTINNVMSPRDMAFDHEGNLWVVTGESTIEMYAAERMLADETGAYANIQGADLSITAAYEGQVSGQFRDPSSLAFDDQGVLWVAWFANNALTPLTPSDLQDGDEVIPDVILSLPVDVLLEDIAFDEEGGLWYTSAAQRIARIAPSDLTTSAELNGPTLKPETLDYAGGLVFYPPPIGSPIAF